jgi:competence protein ComEA
MFRKRVGILVIACAVLLFSGMGLPAWADSYKLTDKAQVAAERVNINTASREELIKLKGVGPANADRIIEYREKYGPFQKPEDITKVKGIGEKKWEANRDVITVE